MSYLEEVQPEILSIQALNPYVLYSSPARSVMFGSQFSQRPVISGSEPKLSMSGVEEEMGKYTFSVKMPEDGTIVAKFPKYSQGIGEDVIDFNPETLVIYCSESTGKYGCFVIPYHASHDPVFGFKYDIKPDADNLAPGVSVAGGTIFADSPAVKGEHHYTYSKNLNIAYMSHPNVGLDGYVISRDALEFFKFRLYEKRAFEFGTTDFPLNIGDDPEKYLVIPELGSYIKESGLVACIRRMDDLLSPALTSEADTRRIDYQFDTPVFSRPGKGRVVDLTVIESGNTNRKLPSQMTQQLEKYKNGYLHYCNSLIRFHQNLVNESLKKGRKGFVPMTQELRSKIIAAKAIKGHRDPSHQNVDLTLQNKKKPLDVWRVEMTVEYEITPDRGYKFSCENGGKGVLCRIEEPENMPVDSDGNRAHIITGPDSVPSRMNVGRVHGPFMNAAARDVRKMMLEEIGYPRHFVSGMSLDDLYNIPKEQLDRAVALLVDYYEITSSKSYDEFVNILTPEERMDWLLYIFNNHLYNVFPIGMTRSFSDMIKEISPQYFESKEHETEIQNKLSNRFNLIYGPVSYVGHSGRRVTTKNNIRVAPIPIMLLDKIADGWLAAATGKHSNFGIITAVNRADKYTRPWKRTNPRGVGETEGRLYLSYGGPKLIAELIDRNGNLYTQRVIPNQILRANKPFNIENLVDRKKIPFGNTQPLQMTNQFFYCMGMRIIYEPETPLDNFNHPPMSDQFLDNTDTYVEQSDDDSSHTTDTLTAVDELEQSTPLHENGHYAMNDLDEASED